MLDALLPRDGWSTFTDRLEDANQASGVPVDSKLSPVPRRVPDAFVKAMCRLEKHGKDAIAHARRERQLRPRMLAMDAPRAVNVNASRFKDVISKMGLYEHWMQPALERIVQQAAADTVGRQHAIIAASAAWRAEMLHALGPLQDEPGIRELFLLLGEADGVHASLAAVAGIALSPIGAVRFGPIRLGDDLVARAVATQQALGSKATPDEPDVPPHDAGGTYSPKVGVLAGLPYAAEAGVSVASTGVRAASASCSPASPAGRSFFASGRPRSLLAAAGSGSVFSAASGSPPPSGFAREPDATAGGARRVASGRGGLAIGPLFDSAVVAEGPAAPCGEVPRSRTAKARSERASRRPPVASGAASAYLRSLGGVTRCDGASRASVPKTEKSPPLTAVGGEAAEHAAAGSGLRLVGGRLFVGSARVPRSARAAAFSSSNASSQPSMASAGTSQGLGSAYRAARPGQPPEPGSREPRVSFLQLLRWWLPELQEGCEPPGTAAGLNLEAGSGEDSGPLISRLRLLHMFRTPQPPTTEASAGIIATGRGRVAGQHGHAGSPSFNTPEERHRALLRLRGRADGAVAQHAREALAATRDSALGRLAASSLLSASPAASRPGFGRTSPRSCSSRHLSGSVGGVGGDILDRQVSASSLAATGAGGTSCPPSPVLGAMRPPQRAVSCGPQYPVLASLVAPTAPPAADSLQGLGIGAPSTPASSRRHRSRTMVGSVSSVTSGQSSAARSASRRPPPPSPSSASRIGRAASYGRAMSASHVSGLPGTTPPSPSPVVVRRNASAPDSASGSSVGSVASTMPLPGRAVAPPPILQAALPAIASRADSESPSTARSGRHRSVAGSVGGRSGSTSPAGSHIGRGDPSPRHWRNPALPLSLPGLGEAVSISPGGQVSHIVRQVVSMEDMRPLVESLVDGHASTSGTIAVDETLRSRFITVALAQLMCVLHGQNRCDVTAVEVLDSSLAQVFANCSRMDLERVLPFRPSETVAMSRAFDDIAGTGRDFFTVEDARARYQRWLEDCDDAGDFVHPAPFVVPMAVVERAMHGHARQLASGVRGTFNFEDWVFFELAQQDAMRDTSIEYWFNLVDRDGDGVISRHDVIDASKSFDETVDTCKMTLHPSFFRADKREPRRRGSVVDAAGSAGLAAKGRSSRATALLTHVRAIAESRSDLAFPLHAEARRHAGGPAAATGGGAPEPDDAAPWSTVSMGAASTARSASASSGRDRSASFDGELPPERDAGARVLPGLYRSLRGPHDSGTPLVAVLIRWSGVGPEIFSLLLCAHSRSSDPYARLDHWNFLVQGSRLAFTHNGEASKRRR